jgi:hypothetical protein
MSAMSTEALEVQAAGIRSGDDLWALQWTPIVAGAFVAAAMSSILITFGVAVGLGVSSASPTWRDASFALWLLSGTYLILQALVSFGCGGYVAGRCRIPYESGVAEDIERRDGMQGISSWALAVLIGAILTALVAMGASRPTNLTQPTSTTEPSVLSYEIDHLFRPGRRPPDLNIAPLRSEAARVLMTASSHSGVSSDDRTYLVQLVNTTTGLTGADAERRVDGVIAASKTAISRARAATVILAFSIAAGLLLGAAAAWAGAGAGGRHRDGLPLPDWMLRANRHTRKRSPALTAR